MMTPITLGYLGKAKNKHGCTITLKTLIFLFLTYYIQESNCGYVNSFDVDVKMQGTLEEEVHIEDEDSGGRLPRTHEPYHYRVWLQPYFTEAKDGHKFLDLDGKVDIYFKCLEDTDRVTVHQRMTILKYELYDISDAVEKQIPIAGNSTITEYDWFVINTVDLLESGTSYRLSMEYVGTVNNTDDRGFYYGNYVEDGQNKTFVATQFESVRARRAFPCFDEPDFKATFDTILVYRPEYVALSNMETVRNDTYYDPNTDDVWNVTYFNTTVKMSTYLNAYTIGDWACIESTSRTGIKFRIWSQPSLLYQAEYALEVGMIQLSNFEDLWGMSYALRKMDMSALPIFGPGAMENWGLILYREVYLLYNEEEHSPSRQKAVAQVIGHETIHQWFGNVVTMDWWSHLWLNEGFASYFEYYGANWVEPGFQYYEQFFQEGEQYSTFNKDQQGDSHPLIMDISTDESEITSFFDTITYSKGSSIIMLMRGFMGEDLLFKGFRNYLNWFAYDNAVSDDLWRVLTETIEHEMGENITEVFGFDMKQIMDTWTLQMGFPVVDLIRTSHSNVQAHQKHFLKDPNDVVEDEDFGNLGYVWHIPLTFTHEAEQLFENPKTTWLHLTSAEFTLDGADEIHWYIANINQTALIRVNYDLENWGRLAQQLLVNHEALPVRNRAHLINDALVLGQAQQLDHVVSMEIIQYLYNEIEYIPWQAYIAEQYYTKYMLWRTSTYGLLQKYIRYLVSPNYANLGWDFDPTDDIDYYRRLDTLQTACDYNHVDCVDNATLQYADWMSEPLNNKIEEDMRSNVYCTAIRHGGENEWIFAYEQQKVDSEETTNLRSAMACTKLGWLLTWYMEEALRGKDFDARVTIRYVQDNSALGFGLAWDFTVQNFEALKEIYGDSAYDIVWAFADKMNTNKDLIELKAFGDLYSDMPIEAAMEFNRAIERVETNILWVDRNMDEIRLFFESMQYI